MNRYESQIYANYEDLDQNVVEENRRYVDGDKINYPSIHIAPKHGLLNDPNGLVYHNGIYHIFYQYCPNGVEHGMKHWNLVTTKDFISYKDHGIILTPTEEYENYGIFSGGAAVIEGKINLLYTANHRDPDDDYKRYPFQCIATLDDEYNVIEKRVLVTPDYTVHTEHFRDPVAIDSKRLLIGAQDTRLQGQLAIVTFEQENYLGSYTTEYLENDWNLQAYMFECPNIFQIDGQEVIMFSPQGVKPSDKYNFQNIHDVVYILNGEIHQLDFGFDFYAPQVFKDDSRTLLVGWQGLPDTIYPGDNENKWSQMLTMVRELKIIDGKLVQMLVKEYEKLRRNKQLYNESFKLSTRCFELNFNICDGSQLVIGNDKYNISLSYSNNEVCLDRSQMQYLVNEEYGTKRYCKLDEDASVKLIYDNSSVDIYIGTSIVMSSRIFIDVLSEISFNNIDDIIFYELESIRWE